MTTHDIQAELDLRTDIKTNGVAIVERGSTRHYYKKLAHGWKHISTSTDASPSFDHEQTKEQREEALKQTAKVEEAMKKWFAAHEQPKATATTINNGQIPEFDYRAEPSVLLEVEHEIEHGDILGLPLQRRRTFINLQIPAYIAKRDGWDFVKFGSFTLVFDAVAGTPVRVTSRILTLHMGFSGDIAVKAEVVFK